MASRKGTPARQARGGTPALRQGAAVVLIVVGSVGAVLFADALIRPGLKFLAPEHGARWIRHSRPFSLSGWGPVQDRAIFRNLVTVPPSHGPLVLTVRALWGCDVHVDGQPVANVPSENQSWRQAEQVALPDGLAPGKHELSFAVQNNLGPAALLAFCDALDLKTGPHWEEWKSQAGWQPAWTADDVELPAFSRRFESPLHALARCAWWLGTLFIAVWGVLTWAGRGEISRGWPRWLTASRVRWTVLGAWLVLGGNNFLRLPSELGYDLQGHADYIRFIAERGQLPDARDGIQMFQSPLYYALSAAVYRLLVPLVSGGTALLYLRWVPLLCGMAQVEICFRAGRAVFPGRDDLQGLTVLVGGLLPMNVYMSQVLGNEPLAGALSAGVLWLGLQGQAEPGAAQRPAYQWGQGVLLGLALLAKMSALLLAPIVAVQLFVANRRLGWFKAASACGRCLAAAALLSGWYYARNWLRLGHAFVGGWEHLVTGFHWWQDPGYRTPTQMASFGESLFHPIHAAFYSIWDGFYSTLWLDGNLSAMNSWESRPPWNGAPLLAAVWPALLLSAAMAAGMLRAARCPDEALRRSLRLAAGSLLVYLAAFALLCLRVPAFSAAKASYTLGLTPVYAVLCAAGLDALPQNRPLRAAVAAFVICFGILVYGAYFVVSATG